MDFDCQEKNDQNLQFFISNLDFDTTTAESTKDETELSSSHGKISESEIDYDLSEFDFEYAERQRSMTLEQFDAIFSDTGKNENDNLIKKEECSIESDQLNPAGTSFVDDLNFELTLSNTTNTQQNPIYRIQKSKEPRLRSLSDLIQQKVKRLSLKSKSTLRSKASSTTELDINSLKDHLTKKTQMTASMASFLKLTLVGDGGVGKSCLILQYMYGDFVEEYEPTKADAYRRTITLQGDEVQIDILDTAGQEDYPAVRDGYLKHGDGFLLVFDLTNRETFESIKNHRENVLRVKSDDPQLPIILIGNKSDLEENRRISHEEARGLAQAWNMEYVETSAKTRENVDKAFSEIFVKIKELKAERQRNSTGSSGKNKLAQSNMTKEEEEAVRADSMRKRVKKWYRNAKKQCFLS